MSTTDTQPVYCVAFNIAKPGCEDKLRDALLELVPQVHQEEGFVSYDLHQDFDDPRRFVITEQWRDRATFDAHTCAPHVKVFEAKAGAWIESGFYHPLARIS